jgi:hypothetical protein
MAKKNSKNTETSNEDRNQEQSWVITNEAKTITATLDNQKIIVSNINGKGLGIGKSDQNSTHLKISHKALDKNFFLRKKLGMVVSNEPVLYKIDQKRMSNLEKEFEDQLHLQREGTLSAIKELLAKINVDCPFSIEHIAFLE